MGDGHRHQAGRFRGQQAQANQPFGFRRLGVHVFAGPETAAAHWLTAEGGELNVEGGKGRRNARIVENHELHGKRARRVGGAADLQVAGAVVSLQPSDLHGQGGQGKNEADHHPSGKGRSKARTSIRRRQGPECAKDFQAGATAQAPLRSRDVPLVNVEAGAAVGTLDGRGG